MYLLVFVTLVVALIGTYAQIYTKQAARAFTQQTGVAETMMSWHTTAVNLAVNLVKASDMTLAGCSLTNLTGLGNPPPQTPCHYNDALLLPVYVGTNYTSSTYTGANECDGLHNTPCWSNLPAGFQAGSYQFYSVAFQGGTPVQNYVLTYVPPTASSGEIYPGLGLLCLPGIASGAGTTCPSTHKQFALTFNEFFKQLRQTTTISPMFYGTVTASSTLTTPSFSLGGNTPASLSYAVPSTVPIGSVGVITQIATCPVASCGT